MPRYTPNPIIPVTRGSFGEITISRNRYGLYTKMKAQDPNDPNTPAQQAVRGTFTTSSQEWRTLTEAQRLSFVRLAPSVTNIGRKSGEPVNPTGFGLYGQLNNTLVECRGSRITTAPSRVETSTDAVNDAGDLFKLSTTEMVFDEGIRNFALVEATPPLSAGVMSVPKTRYRIIRALGTFTPGTPHLYDWKLDYQAEYQRLPLVGEKVAFRVTIVTQSGFRMTPVLFFGIITA